MPVPLSGARIIIIIIIINYLKWIFNNSSKRQGRTSKAVELEFTHCPRRSPLDAYREESFSLHTEYGQIQSTDTYSIDRSKDHTGIEFVRSPVSNSIDLSCRDDASLSPGYYAQLPDA